MNRPTRLTVPCPKCGGAVGWHVVGIDRWQDAPRYCGTLLPRGVEYVGQDPGDLLTGGLLRFGRLDSSRLDKPDGRAVRHVRASGQVEPPLYPQEVIRQADGACGMTTRFKSIRAFAPFRVWCFTCGHDQLVEPPMNAIVDRSPDVRRRARVPDVRRRRRAEAARLAGDVVE